MRWWHPLTDAVSGGNYFSASSLKQNTFNKPSRISDQFGHSAIIPRQKKVHFRDLPNYVLLTRFMLMGVNFLSWTNS